MPDEEGRLLVVRLEVPRLLGVLERLLLAILDPGRGVAGEDGRLDGELERGVGVLALGAGVLGRTDRDGLEPGLDAGIAASATEVPGLEVLRVPGRLPGRWFEVAGWMVEDPPWADGLPGRFAAKSPGRLPGRWPGVPVRLEGPVAWLDAVLARPVRELPGPLPGRWVGVPGLVAPSRGVLGSLFPTRADSPRPGRLAAPPTPTGRRGFQTVPPGAEPDPRLSPRRPAIVSLGRGGLQPKSRLSRGFQPCGRGGRPPGGHTERGRGG